MYDVNLLTDIDNFKIQDQTAQSYATIDFNWSGSSDRQI